MKDESSDIRAHAEGGAADSEPSAILGVGSACAPKLPACGAGFWISPAGLAVRVTPTHIAAVCSFPEKFGYTKAKVESVYARFGEPLFSEGNARREILVDLIGRGWIRVRHYRNRGWTVNIGKDASAARARAVRFFALLLAGNPDIRYDTVRLDSPSGVEVTSVLDFVEGNGEQGDACSTLDARASDMRFLQAVQELPDLGNAPQFHRSFDNLMAKSRGTGGGQKTVPNLKSLHENQEQFDRVRQRLAEAVAEADKLISDAESRLCTAPLLEGVVKADATFNVPGVGEPLRLALEVRPDRYGPDHELHAEIVVVQTVESIFRDPVLKRQRPVVRVAAAKVIPGLVRAVTVAYEGELALVEDAAKGA